MADFKAIFNSSMGPLRGTQAYDGSSALSTTATKVTLPAAGVSSQLYRVTLQNLTAAATGNRLAYALVANGAAAPAITSTPGSASGVIVPAGGSHTFTFTANRDLYVVGSAASTVWSIAIFVE